MTRGRDKCGSFKASLWVIEEGRAHGDGIQFKLSNTWLAGSGSGLVV